MGSQRLMRSINQDLHVLSNICIYWYNYIAIYCLLLFLTPQLIWNFDFHFVRQINKFLNRALVEVVLNSSLQFFNHRDSWTICHYATPNVKTVFKIKKPTFTIRTLLLLLKVNIDPIQVMSYRRISYIQLILVQLLLFLI